MSKRPDVDDQKKKLKRRRSKKETDQHNRTPSYKRHGSGNHLQQSQTVHQRTVLSLRHQTANPNKKS